MITTATSGSAPNEFCTRCGWRRGRHQTLGSGPQCPAATARVGTVPSQPYSPTSVFAGSGVYAVPIVNSCAHELHAYPAFVSGIANQGQPHSVDQLDEWCAVCGTRRGKHRPDGDPKGSNACPVYKSNGQFLGTSFRGTSEYGRYDDGDSGWVRWPKFGSAPGQPVKRVIPDWPHACPGCGGSAYCGAVSAAAECQKSCRPQYARRPS